MNVAHQRVVRMKDKTACLNCMFRMAHPRGATKTSVQKSMTVRQDRIRSYGRFNLFIKEALQRRYPDSRRHHEMGDSRERANYMAVETCKCKGPVVDRGGEEGIWWMDGKRRRIIPETQPGFIAEKKTVTR